MNLSRRSYYYTSEDHLGDEEVATRIGDMCLEFPCYGYCRVTRHLQREGWKINHKKVARIMREKSWSCKPRRRKWIATTNNRHGFPVYPNLAKNLAVTNVNQLWVSDITHIRIMTCFIYLAIILDAFSRKAVGHALSRQIDTNLTLDALRMAIADRHPGPGCIHHSDRGVQYASGDYVKELNKYAFRISISRRGNPYDNAYAESFMKTLKAEEVSLWEYRTMADVLERVPFFIEDVYNRKRLHSSLGYMPPCEYEEMVSLTPNPCQDALIALP